MLNIKILHPVSSSAIDPSIKSNMEEVSAAVPSLLARKVAIIPASENREKKSPKISRTFLKKMCSKIQQSAANRIPFHVVHTRGRPISILISISAPIWGILTHIGIRPFFNPTG